MNELIDQLAFDAGCQRHKYWDPKHPDLEGFIISQAALDKFAELIVRECVNTLEFHGFDEAIPYIKWMATNKLGHRFGVEE